MKTTLHHCEHRITKNSLEIVRELFQVLGCHISYQENGTSRVMVSQNNLSFDIQLVEVDDEPIMSKTRINSHIAFLSEDPREVIVEIEKWCQQRNVTFTKGAWNNKGYYFDLPEIFVDFVVEVMHTSVAE